MAIDTEQKSPTDGKVCGIFKLPFRQTGNNTRTTPFSFSASNLYVQTQPHAKGSNHHGSAISVSSVAKSLLPNWRRLKLDPANKLYFPFSNNCTKSCFMRLLGAILTPDENIIATVFKFVEPPENNEK
ncbi:vesicle-associated protein 4-3-like [Gossypium raimondii]|uniref:vesicle-associated protein 4-3-like n=1 Tax=Gossypium raimondii TaxID=29730 RepID=UPI00227D1F11|nr:vesicle-associated protein 4-3-like [Gossypium raimondii]